MDERGGIVGTEVTGYRSQHFELPGCPPSGAASEGGSATQLPAKGIRPDLGLE